jgi:integrase
MRKVLVLTPDELRGWIEAGKSCRERLLISLMALMGLRLTEALALRWSQVFDDAGDLRDLFLVPAHARNVTYLTRIVPRCVGVDGDLAEWAKHRRTDDDGLYVFGTGMHGRAQMNARTGQRLAKQAYERGVRLEWWGTRVCRESMRRFLFECKGVTRPMVYSAMNGGRPENVLYYLGADGQRLWRAWDRWCRAVCGKGLRGPGTFVSRYSVRCHVREAEKAGDVARDLVTRLKVGGATWN